VLGYGGVSRLQCSEDSTHGHMVRGFPCVEVRHFSMEKLQDVHIHNVGERAAHVHVKIYKGKCC